MRGTLRHSRQRCLSFRFIPARAGNSFIISPVSIRSPVHPRACGELAVDPVGESVDGGSSPRVRGTQRHRFLNRLRIRFIPARAGNSPLSIMNRPYTPVHPRACGELNAVVAWADNAVGSSPRVRGTQSGDWAAYYAHRFIPARAGNSLTHNWKRELLTVHPRACGELAFEVAVGILSDGSSPRVRGTLPGARGRSERQRFIPARAGNSVHSESRKRSPPVHPRACGELSSAARARAFSVGSSPRVRGTPWRFTVAPRLDRFIPARAGNSTAASRCFFWASVHPRACGELFPSVVLSTAISGSSPRVRGTRAGPHRDPPICRFIPARAGNSMERMRPSSSFTVHPRACGELSFYKGLIIKGFLDVKERTN